MSSKPKGGTRAAKATTGEAEPEKPTKPKKSKKPDASGMAYARERIGSATGTSEKELQDRLLNQVLAGVWVRNGHSEDGALMATLTALEALAPTDAAEGMLATQMVATHEAAMECLHRAMISEQTFEGRDVNLKHAEKLMQIYARQLEVLDKRKGRGQQKITVEHVTVEAGGQAIMGECSRPW